MVEINWNAALDMTNKKMGVGVIVRDGTSVMFGNG
jgi:hypothetical protein